MASAKPPSVPQSPGGTGDPSMALSLLRAGDWLKADVFAGRFEGRALGTGISVIVFSSEEVGAGPPLHTHPYDEVFIVKEGRAELRIGDTLLTAERGDVVLGPANVPHAFRNLGPGRLSTTDIHLNADIIQTDLDEPPFAESAP
ncbi:MAG: cupin domain-containing protein [Pseudomonadota bacterium]